MQSKSRIRSILILALATGLAARGEGVADEPPAAGGADPCPSVADIGAAVGIPVKPVSVPIDGCMYELTGRYRGAFVTLKFQPASRADDVYADFRKRVRVLRGKDAEPERLSLGEGGWAFGTSSQSHAAAVANGRLFHVEMDYAAFQSLGNQKDAAVRVLELAMRAGPAGERAASAGGRAPSLDACELATNAEVAEVAEEKPEFARFWSPPEAALGGSHCDYSGGSIRVYQGKTAAADLEGTLKNFGAGNASRAPVQGIGDKAFFMVPYPGDKYRRLGLLAVYAGPQVVTLTLDANGDEPVEATRPRLERFAKLVLPRLQ